MAFDSENFIPMSAHANSNLARFWSYISDADDLATIKGANYFDNAALTDGFLGLRDTDLVFVEGTDGSSVLKVAVSSHFKLGSTAFGRRVLMVSFPNMYCTPWSPS